MFTSLRKVPNLSLMTKNKRLPQMQVLVAANLSKERKRILRKMKADQLSMLL